MKVAIYSFHKLEKEYYSVAEFSKHELKYIDTHLSIQSTQLPAGCKAVSIFVSDNGLINVLNELKKLGVEFLILRSTGYNHVNLVEAKKLYIRVTSVPKYSPYAVAELTITLILARNRKIVRAHQRVMNLKISLDGLVGFDMNGKTVGIIGTGKIGRLSAKILHGYGCRILAYDQVEIEELKQKYNATYTGSETLCNHSDIISLHVPLTEKTQYIINKHCIEMMKPGVMLINPSRGQLVNTEDVIDALKSGHIGSFGLDVYEEEEGLFFEDHSEDILQDDVIARHMKFRNILITSHQAFLTSTAFENIAKTTLYNLDCFEKIIIFENELQ